MTKKPIYLLLSALPFIGLTSCSDEPDLPDDGDVIPYDINDDLLYGKVIFSLDLSTLTEGDYFLETSEPVDFYTYGTTSIELIVEDHDNNQCLTAKVADDYKGERLVFPAYAVGRETGAKRNVIIVAENTLKIEEDAEGYDENAELAAISPLFPTYGNFLGKGTLCYEKLGNTTRDILLFNRLPLQDGNLFNYANVNKTSVDEIHDTSFESVTKSWAFNVGVSAAAKGFTGGLSFGMHDMSKQSKDYEYYMSYLKVERTEMRLLIDEIQKMANRDNKSALSLLGFFATSFCEDLLERCYDTFTPSVFYNTWGTDMIYQGTLGGECKFVFSREENTYQHTIGTDIKAYVKHENEVQPNSKMGQWYNIFLQKSNEPDFKTSFDVSWQKEEYRKASHSELKVEALGGNAATDPNEWLKAFQNDDEYSKWSVVSYLTSRDQKSTDSWYLYRMDEIGADLVNAVEKVFVQTNNMSDADKMILVNARRNIQSLFDKRKDFIEAHKVVEAERTPLIVADIKMVNTKDRRKSGKPQPFTAPNPTNSSQYLTYYPMICNDNFDIQVGNKKMRGKPLDTNDDVFVASVHYSSHYWYYAMAHASDDCPGLTAIEFLTESEAHKNSKYRDYHKHGDQARNGLGGLLVNKRYCYVKYHEKGSKEPIITAVGFWDDSNKYKNHPAIDRIFATTGGTEWLPNYTGEQRKKFFETFWNSGNYTKTSNTFYHGGGVIPHPIKMIYSTAQLPVNDMKELPKVQLPTW